MDFSKVKSLTIPEGGVIKITSGNVVLWTKPKEPANSGKQRKGRKAQLNLARPFPMSRSIQRFKGINSNPQVTQKNSRKLIPY